MTDRQNQSFAIPVGQTDPENWRWCVLVRLLQCLWNLCPNEMTSKKYYWSSKIDTIKSISTFFLNFSHFLVSSLKNVTSLTDYEYLVRAWRCNDTKENHECNIPDFSIGTGQVSETCALSVAVTSSASDVSTFADVPEVKCPDKDRNINIPNAKTLSTSPCLVKWESNSLAN